MFTKCNFALYPKKMKMVTRDHSYLLLLSLARLAHIVILCSTYLRATLRFTCLHTYNKFSSLIVLPQALHYVLFL